MVQRLLRRPTSGARRCSLATGEAGLSGRPELGAVGSFCREGIPSSLAEADRTNIPPAPAEEQERAEPLANGQAEIEADAARVGHDGVRGVRRVAVGGAAVPALVVAGRDGVA